MSSILFKINRNTLEEKHTAPWTFDKVLNTSLCTSKEQIQKRVFQENKARQIFQKTPNISYPLIRTYMCVSGGKKYSFFGKFGVFCFLETLALRFALLPYYQRYYVLKYSNMPQYAEQKIFIFK